MRLVFLAALPLLLLPLAYAQAEYSVPGGTCYVGALGSSDAFSIITMAFMFVTITVAVAYMYSRARSDPAMGVWAKDEGFNLLISAFLFIGLTVFFTGTCFIVEDMAGGSPFAAANSYLRGLLQANGQNILKQLSYGSISNQLDATSYLYVGFTPFFGSGVAGRANMRAHSALKEFLIDLYLPILASLNAQMYILQAIEWVGTSVLLPFAFVLRLLPPTREFGNMLIAIFFGLYIVVPTMYAVSGKAFTDITDPAESIESVNPTVNPFYSYGLDYAGTQGKGTVFYKIGSTLPQAIFLPNLVIIVTITCVMALSKALRAIAV